MANEFMCIFRRGLVPHHPLLCSKKRIQIHNNKPRHAALFASALCVRVHPNPNATSNADKFPTHRPQCLGTGSTPCAGVMHSDSANYYGTALSARTRRWVLGTGAVRCRKMVLGGFKDSPPRAFYCRTMVAITTTPKCRWVFRELSNRPTTGIIPNSFRSCLNIPWSSCQPACELALAAERTWLGVSWIQHGKENGWSLLGCAHI